MHRTIFTFLFLALGAVCPVHAGIINTSNNGAGAPDLTFTQLSATELQIGASADLGIANIIFSSLSNFTIALDSVDPTPSFVLLEGLILYEFAPQPTSVNFILQTSDPGNPIATFSSEFATALDTDQQATFSTFVSYEFNGAAFNGDDTAVPVPATLALVGLGFVGLGLTRRKQS